MKIVKTVKRSFVFIAAFILLASFSGAELLADVIASVDIHDRVGDGWHMYTSSSVSSDGTIVGTTTLKNYNNLRGFTGGLFVVAVDKNMNPIYTTDVHQWGINSAFFSKCRSKTVTWNDKIPDEYLKDLASIAIIQQHTPTQRVWVWIYENRNLIIEKAQLFVEFFKKAKAHELTDDDIWQAVSEVAELLQNTNSDVWAIEHIGDLAGIARQIYDLAKKEPESWIPENVDDAKTLVNSIIALTEKELDWNNIDEVELLVEDVISLMEHPKGWIPENMKDVQAIIENIYVLVKDEPVPSEVKNIITIIIDRLDRMNN